MDRRISSDVDVKIHLGDVSYDNGDGWAGCIVTDGDFGNIKISVEKLPDVIKMLEDVIRRYERVETHGIVLHFGKINSHWANAACHDIKRRGMALGGIDFDQTTYPSTLRITGKRALSRFVGALQGFLCRQDLVLSHREIRNLIAVIETAVVGCGWIK